MDILQQLQEAGIQSAYIVGGISEAVCQISVSMNRIGMVLLGGLNPGAAAVESGIDVENNTETGMVDFQQLIQCEQLLKRQQAKTQG